MITIPRTSVYNNLTNPVCIKMRCVYSMHGTFSAMTVVTIVKILSFGVMAEKFNEFPCKKL